MISRSYYFFTLNYTANLISRIRFRNVLQVPCLSKISIGFFFPKLKEIFNIRTIFSFFVLKRIFLFKPKLRFIRRQFARKGHKKIKEYHSCMFSIYNITKFLWLDFFTDVLYTHTRYKLSNFITLSFPLDRFTCILQNPSLLPFFSNIFIFRRVLLCISFFFSNALMLKLNIKIFFSNQTELLHKYKKIKFINKLKKKKKKKKYCFIKKKYRKIFMKKIRTVILRKKLNFKKLKLRKLNLKCQIN